MKRPSIAGSFGLFMSSILALMASTSDAQEQPSEGGGKGGTYCMSFCVEDPKAFCETSNPVECQSGVCTGDSTKNQYPYYVVCL
jgi:hypothetical protein